MSCRRLNVLHKKDRAGDVTTPVIEAHSLAPTSSSLQKSFSFAHNMCVHSRKIAYMCIYYIHIYLFLVSGHSPTPSETYYPHHHRHHHSASFPPSSDQGSRDKCVVETKQQQFLFIFVRPRKYTFSFFFFLFCMGFCFLLLLLLVSLLLFSQPFAQ